MPRPPRPSRHRSRRPAQLVVPDRAGIDQRSRDLRHRDTDHACDLEAEGRLDQAFFGQVAERLQDRDVTATETRFAIRRFDESERPPERADHIDLGPDLRGEFLDRQLVSLWHHEAVEREQLVGARRLGRSDRGVGHAQILEDVSDRSRLPTEELRHARIVR
jgi:hypothetical protein